MDFGFVPPAGFAALGLLLSVCGVWLTLHYARRVGLLDVPNHRSSHTISTPRGGGAAVVASVVIVSALDAAAFGVSGSGAVLIAGIAVVGIAILGWLDDRGSMPVSLRLPLHFAAGLAVAWLVNEIVPVPGIVNFLWLGWWAFWAAASINIVNFMDGIDGMVASQGVIYGIFLFALMPPGIRGADFGLILSAACLGFLIWNWAPSKIFLGDVGSGPLGLFFVIGGAFAAQSARAAIVFLPLFPLYLDALVTVVLRYRRGEDLTLAHRSHLYQRIANGGAGHAIVTGSYALAAAVGALVGVTAQSQPTAVMTVMIAGYCLAVIAAWLILHSRFTVVAADSR